MEKRSAIPMIPRNRPRTEAIKDAKFKKKVDGKMDNTINQGKVAPVRTNMKPTRRNQVERDIFISRKANKMCSVSQSVQIQPVLLHRIHPGSSVNNGDENGNHWVAERGWAVLRAALL